MLTLKQANFIHANINTFIAWMFIASYSLAVWLVLWHALYNSNPIADILAAQMIAASQ